MPECQAWLGSGLNLPGSQINPDPLFSGGWTHLDPLDPLNNVPLHETGQAGLRRHVDVAPSQHGELKLLDVGAEHGGAEIKLMVAQSLS